MADVKEYLRFSVSQILEHWVMAISFTACRLPSRSFVRGDSPVNPRGDFLRA